MSQTLIEKIAQRFAVGLPADHEVHVGDYLSIRPFHVMTHDNTGAVIPKFESMGATKVADPAQPVFALDHDIQNKSEQNLAKYAKIEAFAEKHGVAFHPAGRGIGHQVMLEEGFALPGTFVVASDSHSNIYGALGALGTPVVRTDAAAIWATGRTWWQVPQIVRVNLAGELRPGVSGKDVIITLIGTFKNDEVLNCCIEFAGPGVANLSIEQRMTISNMTTEWGALAGVFPYDAVTRQFLLERAQVLMGRAGEAPAKPRLSPEIVDDLEADLPVADADTTYAKELDFDLSAVTPFVAGPNEVKKITAVSEIEQQDVRIDKAFLMSCVNGRLEDFAEAAGVIKGQRVADHVKLYVAAASDEIEAQAMERGHWRALTDAGAIALPPGCGACIGLGEGLLESGEVGVSATNRNFKGRMGAADSFVYLASPAVVAASAVAGKIAGSGPAGQAPDLAAGAKCREIPRPAGGPAPSVEILPGFPERIEGELLLIPKDNLNTDGIYGKDYTYKDDMTPEAMAKVAMENYDLAFQRIAQEGDILLGGYNFGSGSSREQAATALKYRGLQMVIAGSFSQTYKRNAFNNGYICIECPELVDELCTAWAGDEKLTIRSGWRVAVDFGKSRIEVGDQGAGSWDQTAKTYAFSPLGTVAQELIVKGGFEAVIRDQLASGT